MGKRKPRSNSLKGKLLNNSADAYVLSLETINRLSIQYRIEAFAYLICNAWELLLKAKIIENTGRNQAIYYKKTRGENRRSLTLRDCLKQVFPNANDPVRRNLERVADLRDEAPHLVIGQIPKDVLALFQACVLNYHRHLDEWWGISLSERVPAGMMTLIYDFDPEQFASDSPMLRKQLGKDAVEYLMRFQEEVQQEAEALGRPTEFLISIDYKLALVKKVGESDIALTKGNDANTVARVVEVPKDPSRTHPYRQKEVIERVNAELPDGVEINQWDIQCINVLYNVKKRPEFHYQASVRGFSPQYSQDFVDWLLHKYAKDEDFFDKAREKRAHVAS